MEPSNHPFWQKIRICALNPAPQWGALRHYLDVVGRRDPLQQRTRHDGGPLWRDEGQTGRVLGGRDRGACLRAQPPPRYAARGSRRSGATPGRSSSTIASSWLAEPHLGLVAEREDDRRYAADDDRLVGQDVLQIDRVVVRPEEAYEREDVDLGADQMAQHLVAPGTRCLGRDGK